MDFYISSLLSPSELGWTAPHVPQLPLVCQEAMIKMMQRKFIGVSVFNGEFFALIEEMKCETFLLSVQYRVQLLDV